MGTIALLFIFCVFALKRPDIALLMYFTHWAYCKVTKTPTLFERVDEFIKRATKTSPEEKQK